MLSETDIEEIAQDGKNSLFESSDAFRTNYWGLCLVGIPQIFRILAEGVLPGPELSTDGEQFQGFFCRRLAGAS
jgi:hypothetical protein